MTEQKKPRERHVGSVRSTDLEPYTALRWVGTLFKAAAVFIAVAVVGEFIAGVRMFGSEAVPQLLGQLARTAVIGVVLWGSGDLVRLLIQMGHDVRAERVLLARVVQRLSPEPVEQLAAAASPVAMIRPIAEEARRVDPAPDLDAGPSLTEAAPRRAAS